MHGGIFGGASPNGVEKTNIYESYNTGTIKTTNGANVGGIAGTGYANFDACYNTGDIIQTGGGSSLCFAGGIGGLYPTAKNCYNTGNITTERNYATIGGITGGGSPKGLIENCYNIGSLKNTAAWLERKITGIGGLTINNCYNLGTVSGGSDRNTKWEIGGTTRNKCYYSSSTNANQNIGTEEGATDISSKSLEEFVELLNSYREEQEDESGNITQVWPEGWKKWKAGEKGYPVFE